MPAWVDPVTLQTMMKSNVSPRSASCARDFLGEADIAEAAELVHGCAGGNAKGLPPLAFTSSIAAVQLSRMPISKPSSTSWVSAPIRRESRMLPTRSFTASSCGTQLSWISRHFMPILAATAATMRV